MMQKKLLVGAVAMALTLSTAIAAYAAEPHGSKQFVDMQYKDKISMSGGNALTFDETDLPDGVQFKNEISMSGSNALNFDENDLPDAVHFKDEISMSSGNNVLTFDETDLPDGAQFKDEISMGGNDVLTFDLPISGR